MKTLCKSLLVCAPIALLAACGGGDDLEDRLDVADPEVRFVHAAPGAPSVTLFRGEVAQSDATNVPYLFASDYFDVSTSTADWSVKTAASLVTVGTQTIDPSRGTKYTIVALPTTDVDSGIYVIADPYNKSLSSDSARVRVMNAAFNAGNIEVYMNAPGTNIGAPGVNPFIASTAYKAAGPASGSDSADIAGGTYQLTITSAGTKLALFQGQVTFGNNKDVLVVLVPDTPLPGSVKPLVKIEGTPGLAAVDPTPIAVD